MPLDFGLKKKKKSVLQKQVDAIYKECEDKCEEDCVRFYQQVRERIGPFRSLSFHWREWSDDAGKNFVNTLVAIGATVAEDPIFDGSDTYAYLVFHEAFRGELTEWEECLARN